MKKKLKQSTVFENTDGFLTKDEKQYKKRQALLNKIKKAEKKEDRWLDRTFFNIELKYWSLPKEKRDHIDLCDRIKEQDAENACPQCDGSGSVEEHGYYGTGSCGCSECSGTGLTKEYREKTGRKKFMDGTWYTLR